MPRKRRPRPGDSYSPAQVTGPRATALQSALAASSLPQTYARIAIALVLSVGVALRWSNVDNVASRTPDEDVYTWLAKLVRSGGTPGLRAFVNLYQHDQRFRQYPPPTRAGFIRLVAAVMDLTGASDDSAGAYLSAACSTVSLLLLGWLALRFFPPWAAVFAALFYAVSPAELAMARRAWQDCLIECLGLALAVFLAESTRGSRRRLWYLALVVVGTFGLSIKESWLLVYGLWGLGALWMALVVERDWKGSLVLVAGGLAGLGASIAWLANQVGGVATVVQIVSRIPAANAANTYAIEFQTGPGYRLVQAFWMLAPIPAMLCLPGLAVALFPRLIPTRLRDTWSGGWIVRLLALFVPAVVIFPFVLPHWLNLRYVSAVFPEVYLLAGLGFWYLASAMWRWVPAREHKLAVALLGALLMLGAFSDYSRFQRVFVTGNLWDLSVKMVVESAGQ